MLVMFVLTVYVDLVTAVTVGIILASFVNSRWLAQERLKGLRQKAEGYEVDLLCDKQ